MSDRLEPADDEKPERESDVQDADAACDRRWSPSRAAARATSRPVGVSAVHVIDSVACLLVLESAKGHEVVGHRVEVARR